jgi:hypothetical protein
MRFARAVTTALAARLDISVAHARGAPAPAVPPPSSDKAKARRKGIDQGRQPTMDASQGPGSDVRAQPLAANEARTVDLRKPRIARTAHDGTTPADIGGNGNRGRAGPRGPDPDPDTTRKQLSRPSLEELQEEERGRPQKPRPQLHERTRSFSR